MNSKVGKTSTLFIFFLSTGLGSGSLLQTTPDTNTGILFPSSKLVKMEEEDAKKGKSELLFFVGHHSQLCLITPRFHFLCGAGDAINASERPRQLHNRAPPAP